MVRQLLLGSKQETVVAWTSMWQWGWKGVKALGSTGEKIDEYWCPLLRWTSLRKKQVGGCGGVGRGANRILSWSCTQFCYILLPLLFLLPIYFFSACQFINQACKSLIQSHSIPTGMKPHKGRYFDLLCSYCFPNLKQCLAHSGCSVQSNYFINMQIQMHVCSVPVNVLRCLGDR